MPSLDYEKIARYYDSYVLVDFDIKFFLEEAKKVSGKVLELMSGTGRVSKPNDSTKSVYSFFKIV
ncbi:MAG: hypothetical protein ISS16_05550 [Ignavibacteria bacterium]|nr:hypothetical protein [Ignavibacteria bacterium]